MPHPLSLIIQQRLLKFTVRLNIYIFPLLLWLFFTSNSTNVNRCNHEIHNHEGKEEGNRDEKHSERLKIYKEKQLPGKSALL